MQPSRLHVHGRNDYISHPISLFLTFIVEIPKMPMREILKVVEERGGREGRSKGMCKDKRERERERERSTVVRFSRP